jgi:hypothetical protein
VQQNQFDWVRMIHVGSNREEWESGLRQQKSWPAE